MITVSPEELPTYQIHAGQLRINHSHELVERTDMDEQVMTEHKYITAICSITSNRSEIIESIIGSKYSPSAEFATINNKDAKPEEYEIYQNFRIYAKELATNYFNQND